MGGVDRIGKGSKVYGINFNVVPWHKHLVTNTLNLNLHAMWTLAQCDSVSEKKEISTSRGITRARMFCLSLTRDVIERAVERIVKAGSFDPRPKKCCKLNWKLSPRRKISNMKIGRNEQTAHASTASILLKLLTLIDLLSS